MCRKDIQDWTEAKQSRLFSCRSPSFFEVETLNCYQIVQTTACRPTFLSADAGLKSTWQPINHFWQYSGFRPVVTNNGI